MAVKRFLLNKFFSVECPESTDESQEKKRKSQFCSVLHPTLLCFKAVERKEKKKKLLAFEKYPFPIGAEALSPSSPGPLLLSDWSDPE